MLKLTRKVGESVVIHNNIYCTVERYSKDEVQLVFHAPRSIPIHRNEVQHRIMLAQNNNQMITETVKTKESVVDRLIRKFKYA